MLFFQSENMFAEVLSDYKNIAGMLYCMNVYNQPIKPLIGRCYNGVWLDIPQY